MPFSTQEVNSLITRVEAFKSQLNNQILNLETVDVATAEDEVDDIIDGLRAAVKEREDAIFRARHDGLGSDYESDSGRSEDKIRLQKQSAKIERAWQAKKNKMVEARTKAFLGISKDTIHSISPAVSAKNPAQLELQRQLNQLKEENEALKQKDAHLEAKAKTLEKKVGAKVRLSSFELIKKIKLPNGVAYRCDPDYRIIDAKNAAVHRGNILADKSLFSKEVFKDPQKFTEVSKNFKRIYGCSPTEVSEKEWIQEVRNLHATMVCCHFEAKGTHDEDTDKRFRKLYDELLGDSGVLHSESEPSFSTRVKIREMAEIADQTNELEKKRLRE